MQKEKENVWKNEKWKSEGKEVKDISTLKWRLSASYHPTWQHRMELGLRMGGVGMGWR